MAKKPEQFDYDERGFREAKELFAQLESDGTKKAEVLKASRDIYLMDWKGKPKSKQVNVTISPDGKNKTKGAVRLLTATVPKFRLPSEKNDPSVEKISSDLEQMANTMWSRSNHIQGVKVERDLALSGFVYDEMILAVICMNDIVERMKEGLEAAGDDKWEKARWEGRLKQAEANAALTPYQFEIMDPLTTSVLYGRNGQEVVSAKVKRKASDVRSHWGARAEKILAGKKDTEEVTECRLVNMTFEYVWLQEKAGEPIFADIHELPFIPIVAVRAEGSRLFEDVRAQYDPFLKTLADSGIWELQNRMFTALNTNITATLDAQWVFKQGQVGDTLKPNFSQLLGVWELPPNSSLEPLTKDIVSKDVLQMWSLLTKTMDDSTIYNQSLGEGAGKGDPYALASLLHQAGRLPLSGVQKMMGEALARMMEITFQWMKHNKKKSKMQAKYGTDLTVDPKDIPAVLEFECTVDVDLPQDKLQQANIAGMLQKGQLASDEWIQGNVLGIENPDQVRKQIFKEMATKVMGGKVVEQVINQMMTPPAPPPNGNPNGAGGPVPTDPNNPQGPADPRAGMNMPVQGGLPPAMAGPMPQQPPDMQMPPEGMPPEMMGGM